MKFNDSSLRDKETSERNRQENSTGNKMFEGSLELIKIKIK